MEFGNLSGVFKVFGLCFALATMGTALKVHFEDCGSVGGKVEELDLSPCSQDPCTIHHRMNYTAKITFTALEDTEAPIRKLEAVVGAASIPFPMDPNACAHGLKCPIKKGDRRVQVTHMYVRPIYPKLRLGGKFSLLDEKRRPIFCIVIPLTIAD